MYEIDDIWQHEDWVGGTPGGFVFYEKKTNLIKFIYRYYQSGRAVTRHTHSMPLDRFNDDLETARTAMLEYRWKYCEQENLLTNRYRVENGVVTLQLGLVTASCPSITCVQFDEADKELVLKESWHHGENEGAFMRDSQSHHISLGAWLMCNGEPTLYSPRNVGYIDGNWRNNRRSNLRVARRVSMEFHRMYQDILSNTAREYGVHESARKRYVLTWREDGHRRRKTFTYVRKGKTQEDALDDLKIFVTQRVTTLLGPQQSAYHPLLQDPQ